MVQDFDDELKRMDEIENESESFLYEALSLDDPISALKLRTHPTVSSNTTLQSVIDILRDQKVGCVMVEKNGKLTGVMTERDFLLRTIGKGFNLDVEIIDNFMTQSPESLQPDDPIAFVLNKMHVLGIRHIPIVNDKDKILGMVSVKDVITYIGNHFGSEIINLPPEPLRGALEKPEGG